MHEWRRRWEVTLTWAYREDSPWKTTRYVANVDTPAQLRAIQQRGRDDRLCTGVHVKPIREMVGTAPETCSGGHPLEGSSALRAPREWIACSCGGHIRYRCAQCGEEITDPVPLVDCSPGSS